MERRCSSQAKTFAIFALLVVTKKHRSQNRIRGFRGEVAQAWTAHFKGGMLIFRKASVDINSTLAIENPDWLFFFPVPMVAQFDELAVRLDGVEDMAIDFFGEPLFL